MGTCNRHYDKEKFRSALNRQGSCEMSERFLKTLRKSGNFQAEYTSGAQRPLLKYPPSANVGIGGCVSAI
jgi:hypothetical protein